MLKAPNWRTMGIKESMGQSTSPGGSSFIGPLLVDVARSIQATEEVENKHETAQGAWKCKQRDEVETYGGGGLMVQGIKKKKVPSGDERRNGSSRKGRKQNMEIKNESGSGVTEAVS